MPFAYAYPHPAVTTDVVVFRVRDARLEVLLIERGGEPFKGDWALPGGFLEPTEDLDACAARELKEETGLEAGEMIALANFSAPGRDPRGWTISAAYLALAAPQSLQPRAGSDAARVGWFAVDALAPLAFDHDQIVARAVAEVRARLPRLAILLNLLAARFTFAELCAAHEAAAGAPADRRNLHKALMASGLVRESGEVRHGPGRPARLLERDPRNL